MGRRRNRVLIGTHARCISRFGTRLCTVSTRRSYQNAIGLERLSQ